MFKIIKKNTGGLIRSKVDKHSYAIRQAEGSISFIETQQSIQNLGLSLPRACGLKVQVV